MDLLFFSFKPHDLIMKNIEGSLKSKRICLLMSLLSQNHKKIKLFFIYFNFTN